MDRTPQFIQYVPSNFGKNIKKHPLQLTKNLPSPIISMSRHPPTFAMLHVSPRTAAHWQHGTGHAVAIAQSIEGRWSLRGFWRLPGYPLRISAIGKSIPHVL